MRTRTLLPGGARLASKLFATVVAATLIGPLGTVSVASGANRPIASTIIDTTRTSVSAPGAPVRHPAAGVVRPASIVTSTACTANACDLWAKAGTYAIPGTTASCRSDNHNTTSLPNFSAHALALAIKRRTSSAVAEINGSANHTRFWVSSRTT